MRFLADMGVSITTVKSLRAEGHDAIHLREENLHRLPDSAILTRARDENRTIITFHLDFGDLLAAVGIHLPSVRISEKERRQAQDCSRFSDRGSCL